jgi:putative membrane protein
VLIYVSLLEHMAWVSGDEAVNAAVPESTWGAATTAIAEASRRGALDKGLIEAVGLVAAAVAAKIPKDSADTNELPNTVYLLD